MKVHLVEKDYLIGLDLGQANDYTAAAVVRRMEALEYYTEHDLQQEGERWPQSGAYAALKAGKPKSRTEQYHCVHLQRWPIGTRYPVIVSEVAEMLRRLPAPQQPKTAWSKAENHLVIDRTGVGRAVYDMFTDLGVRPVGITITGGDKPVRDRRDWSVPKKDLAGALQATLGTGRLKIAPELPETPVLVQELQNFEVRISTSGHAQFAADWRSGTHDDLVLALACAVWYAEHGPKGLSPEAFEPTFR
jgi:hypothetical protein